jgi:arylsulfatase A-like enzyme
LTVRQSPNIILILVDDLGWRDLFCYGSTFYETKNLDRLAEQGMVFTDAYAPSPVCSPTRASILTGKYPVRFHLTNYIGGQAEGRLLEPLTSDHLSPQERTLAQMLQEAGYATWHVGKWHLGDRPYYPENHGFHINLGGCGWGYPRKGYFSPWGIDSLPDAPAGTYLTDHLTDVAIDLIRHRDPSRPFYLNIWHYAVHVPIQAPQRLIHKHMAKAARLGLDKLPAFEEGERFPCLHKREMRITRRRIQSDPVYAAMVENLDWNTGRLLCALQQAGIEQNTLIVFTSDNGGLSTAEGSPTCNAPLAEGKGWMYEGGVRVPLIMHWPGVIPSGTVCHEPVNSCDLYPTLLEIAGNKELEMTGIDGVSLVSLFTKKPIQAHRVLLWHYPHYGNQGGSPSGAIRLGRYKLIEFYEGERYSLYDLQDDISESTDLSGSQPDLAQEMRAILTRWRLATSALMPQPNPRWTDDDC